MAWTGGLLRGLVGGCAVATLTLGGAAIVAAATPTAPGMLATDDLPAGYLQPGTVQSYPTFSLAVTDPIACTETPTPVGGIIGAQLVSFTPPGGTSNTAGLSESVLTFPTTKDAKAAYKVRLRNELARRKCGAVGFIPVNGTAPIATINYSAVKVPKVGSGSFGSAGTTNSGTSPTTSAGPRPMTITFLSGPYLVGLGVAGAPYAPSASDLRSILKNAARQLPHGP